MNKVELYTEVKRRIAGLVEGESDYIALMATISSELFHTFPDFDWVGFYRNMGDRTLKIGPYQGGYGCITIRFDQGVCGRCASTLEPQNVPDVNAIESHIACSSSTQSELVLPVFDVNNALIAVLDIDSNRLNAFDDQDINNLNEILHSSFSMTTFPGGNNLSKL